MTATINDREYKLEKSSTKSATLTYNVVDFTPEDGENITLIKIYKINTPNGPLKLTPIRINNFPWWIVGAALIILIVFIILIAITF